MITSQRLLEPPGLGEAEVWSSTQVWKRLLSSQTLGRPGPKLGGEVCDLLVPRALEACGHGAWQQVNTHT
jgi:hypothetical protein